MPTYAAITSAPSEQVLTALARGKRGGYLYRGPQGTGLLFDPPKPRFGRISRSRIMDPAWMLAVDSKTTVWLLEDAEWGLCVTVCFPGGGYENMGWARDWTPPADPSEYAAHRTDWDSYCGKIARKAGLADPAALAALRNDPAPDGSRTSGEELMRRLCELVGAPTAVIGQSLGLQAGPAGRDFVRFEAKGR
ncbi:hypothetical protein ACFV4G_42315 [Kitasatospora sp. NPDC059747]|uniref:hypothetical protein n=1 Tax=Kitasatospora sp. NPDC059747 TaxID=3346930 RepID=UPI0036528D16